MSNFNDENLRIEFDSVRGGWVGLEAYKVRATILLARAILTGLLSIADAIKTLKKEN